jgi:NAD(P)-dependent dehydrogenase (short-subunit alcohol dehydrogenase family)
MLTGKVAIVTGAGRGLGRAHALTLAKAGAKVVVNDLGVANDGTGKADSPAQEVVNEIKKAGGDAVASYESVAEWDSSKKIIDLAISKFGRLDIMMNNAGFLRDRMTFKMVEDEFDAVIKVHLKGTFSCSRWAIIYWYEQSKAGKPVNGRIINTVSHAGLGGNAGQPNYSAAKGGIAAMTMCWGREMAKYGVTANAIAPMARSRMTLSSSMTKGIMGEEAPKDGSFDQWAPENISPLVVYLGSDEAKDITGHIFTVQGGKLQVFVPWTPGKSITIDHRWTEQELHKRIRELGDLSMPPFPL